MSTGPRIYCTDPLTVDARVELDSQAATHLLRVLRMNPGDALRLFNGDGREYAATLCEAGKKNASATVTSVLRQDAPPALSLHLGQVISKGDRMDFTIQKATELGISEITPLWSERCEVRLKGERLEKKTDHWQKVAISACEQSGRNHLPLIHAPQTLSEWCRNTDADVKCILHPHNQKPLKDYPAPHSLALLVGPEGGFSENEVQQVLSAGFHGLTLGPRILRTETAALAALSVFQYQWGDF
ncbi:MAG: 16S rRNA (uracil(1498)-N(3))-methyltransferase [Oceanospirillaceae bacterium]|nr:16S rRNA (uracil(1498)-N(3))-methyltransferase [Oceanospirillaceae bacterium]MBT11087.1 16S rRNA (uracil(1498)-N(3))-methyltransferase [Oceanospirillaceae bacterium]|tara:strand:- start:30764 stop:31492 length:729 start_codon:yes stop_codon:yes gene_type:complete